MHIPLSPLLGHQAVKVGDFYFRESNPMSWHISSVPPSECSVATHAHNYKRELEICFLISPKNRLQKVLKAEGMRDIKLFGVFSKFQSSDCSSNLPLVKLFVIFPFQYLVEGNFTNQQTNKKDKNRISALSKAQILHTDKH